MESKQILHKTIVSNEDLNKWINSPSYINIVNFIQGLQDSVVGLANDADIQELENCKNLQRLLDHVDATIDHNPIIKDAALSRFGKPEFRGFYDEIKSGSSLWLSEVVPKETTDEHLQELSEYFTESWGNQTRIDYGSGHELNFIAFLFCLSTKPLNTLTQSDYQAIVLKVFTRYIEIMRKLQKIYWLEPAGSHGVWGLDDYHFLPFLFGAAQLSTHPHMKPTLVHNRELVECYWRKYMYLECVHFINSMKNVPGRSADEVSLRWYLPMLDDILAAKNWKKISDGMIKMYKAEVLAKLPIVQHFLFGLLIPAPEGTKPREPNSAHNHNDEDICCNTSVHQNTWGDCCGIPIPSAIAASQSKQGVPFD